MQKSARIAEISTKVTGAYFLLDHPVYHIMYPRCTMTTCGWLTAVGQVSIGSANSRLYEL